MSQVTNRTDPEGERPSGATPRNAASPQLAGTADVPAGSTTVDRTAVPPPAGSGTTLPYTVLRKLSGQMASRLAGVPGLKQSRVLVCEVGDLAGLVAHRQLEADACRLQQFFASAIKGDQGHDQGGLESITIPGAIVAVDHGLAALDAILALRPRIQPLLEFFRTERTYRQEQFRFDRLAVLAAIAGQLQPHCRGISALAFANTQGTFPQLTSALEARRQATRPAAGQLAQDWEAASAALDSLQSGVTGRSAPAGPAPLTPAPIAAANQPTTFQPSSDGAEQLAETLRRGAHLAAALAEQACLLVLEPLTVELIREEQRSWWQGANTQHHCRVACAMLLLDPNLNVLCSDIFEDGESRDSSLLAPTRQR